MMISCIYSVKTDTETFTSPGQLNILTGEIFDLEQAIIGNRQVSPILSETVSFLYEREPYEFDAEIDEHNICSIIDFDIISFFNQIALDYKNVEATKINNKPKF